MVKRQGLLVGSRVRVQYGHGKGRVFRPGVISSVLRDRTFVVDYTDLEGFDIFPIRSFGREVWFSPEQLSLCLEGMVTG